MPVTFIRKGCALVVRSRMLVALAGVFWTLGFSASAQNTEVASCFSEPEEFLGWKVSASAIPSQLMLGREDFVEVTLGKWVDAIDVVFDGVVVTDARPLSFWVEIKASEESVRIVFPKPKEDSLQVVLGNSDFLKRVQEKPFNIELLLSNGGNLATTSSFDKLLLNSNTLQHFFTSDSFSLVAPESNDSFSFYGEMDITGLESAVLRGRAMHDEFKAEMQSAGTCKAGSDVFKIPS